MRRTGLGRRGLLAAESGDPLDGLVNLFDIGIVLAVAFLIAGLSLTVDPNSKRIERKPQQQPAGRPIPSPAAAPPATGQGKQVGKVYRLSDGRLVYVEGR